MKIRVELLYNPECPNILKTRSNLLRALSLSGVEMTWLEWSSKSSDAPPYVKHFGSPTILVDGEDIGGESASLEANESCRVYDPTRAHAGVPPVQLILKHLNAKRETLFPSKRVGLLTPFAIGPGAGAAFMAKVACPFCYPAIAGLLSSAGLGFLFEGGYFIALTLLFLGLAIFGLAFRASTRRGYGPLWLGSLGALSLTFGKWTLEVESLFYLGVIALGIASVWNLLPKRRSHKPCSACAPDEAQIRA